MSRATVHIIGAGLAGLSAAVRLAAADIRVAVHEAAAQAGGRCRSYFDAGFGAVIDNGNHLVLSGNDGVRRYLDLTGAPDALTGPDRAVFDFLDLASGERWRLDINDGVIPVWLLNPSRRVPGTKFTDYLGAARLMAARNGAIVTSVLRPDTPLYNRLWHPLMLAALNTDPAEGSAKLAGAIMRNTLAKGGRACRPLVAREGLSAALIDPAIRFVEQRGGTVRTGNRLSAIETRDGRATALAFGAETISLGPRDAVVLAVPPWVAAALLPGISAPDQFRSIVNAHFRIAPPPGFPEILGLINATTEWIFAFEERISITISGADRLLDTPRDELALTIWREVSQATGLSENLPPWQIIREKRATFAATPSQDAKRPGAHTDFGNIVLAGDWVQTGLPATIEGAIRSGERAAELTKGRLSRPQQQAYGSQEQPELR